MSAMGTMNIDHELSVCIYGVKQEYANEDYFKNLFSKLDIADIHFVQFQANVYNNNFNAIIYINKWHENVMVENLQSKILDQSQTARLVYDDPNYWVLHKNQNLMHIQTIIRDQAKKILQQQSEKIALLESKNETMENTLAEIHGLLNLHGASIEYLASKNNSSKRENSEDIEQLYRNNSCCGAASDAWVPSNPQSDEESKLPFLHWQNRLRMRSGEN